MKTKLKKKLIERDQQKIKMEEGTLNSNKENANPS